eukprot:CAMPEP_0179102038 /NCGR_PEP_ID=MMETSP0796-20121207/47208_1 /TAXON_ID=73915 /ORGANISM="Pyrodinium bahamense, Strain pbaha01" /LENGTH=456 /DNA_ID=CAMNT_0020799905 /DNA_START=48 /DNA_END=1418 /DNA_ORIENTATION=+
MELDAGIPEQHLRGWAMRHGHCRRLKGAEGRESLRGRAAFARSVNDTRGHARRGRLNSKGRQSSVQRMSAYEIAEVVAEETMRHACVLTSPSAAAASWHSRRRAASKRRTVSRWDEAVTLAERRAVEWQLVSTEAKVSRKPSCEKAAAPPETGRFDCIREHFWKEHGTRIRASLQKCFTGEIQLRPASLSPEVKQHFLQRYKSNGNVRPAFHGTNAANHASIFNRGLMIPGGGSGVSVSNGSSHGLGIYTATLDNPFLSRGFCSEPCMLVCAVVDDAVRLTCPRPLGRFFVTAESAAVRHVGDALVVMDPWHVAPLFEASAEGFATPSSFVPAPVACPSQVSSTASSARACKPAQGPGVSSGAVTRAPAAVTHAPAQTVFTRTSTRIGVGGRRQTWTKTTTLTATGHSRTTVERACKKLATAKVSALQRFLSRRAADKRRARSCPSALPGCAVTCA